MIGVTTQWCLAKSLKREQTPYPLVSSDGRYLVVLVQDVSGAEPCSELYLLDREDPRRRLRSHYP